MSACTTQVRDGIARLELSLPGEAINKITRDVRDELEEVRDAFGDDRRTEIVQDHSDLSVEDLIPSEEVVVTLSHGGYAKAQPIGVYQAQKRGGRGRSATKVKDEDFIDNLFVANTHDTILCFSSRGKMYWLKVYQVPQASRGSRGKPIGNLLPLEPGERINAVLPIKDYAEDSFVFMATSGGTVKKTPLSQFSRPRSNGIIAIDLRDDMLVDVALTDGNAEILLVASLGKSIRFRESDVRPMGRVAGGVMAIKLSRSDQVAAMDVVDPEGDLLVITAKGYAKRTRLSEYSTQGRYGSGVATLSKQGVNVTGPIVDARVISADNDITLISAEGMVLRTRVKQIPQMGRSTRGATVMRMKQGDAVVSLALLAPRDKKKSTKKTSSSADKTDGQGSEAQSD